ncbi:hypothetical protein [Streptacidiphilus fuscans]|uniref:Uncharacterized protein n=1 Tax=Streptacidiphilus fuscans TaxID=2789292 RepID=A0A931B1E1_9ACTN|nr:hypothetical protein [Streptacidiphilus fuscans]MBF9066927.1 hypothetical protein [Streptacidiphilus fuscans]
MERPTGRELLALRRLLRDPDAPGLERWPAAKRLGTAGEAEQEFATERLLERDFPMSVASYLAEAMADFAPRFQEQLAERLRGPAAVSGEFDEDRIWAAEALAALGADYRDEGVAALRAAIADPQQGRWQTTRVAQLRWMAAVALADTDPSLRDEAAAVVHQDDIAHDTWENELARATHLRDIGGAPAEEGTRMLLAMREEVDEEFRYDVEEALGLHDDEADAASGTVTATAPVLTQAQADVRRALEGLTALGVPSLAEQFDADLAASAPDRADQLTDRYRAYVACTTAPEATAALAMTVPESAVELTAKLAGGRGPRTFVALSDAAEPQLRESSDHESRVVDALCRELEWGPRQGLHRPERGERTEDYVLAVGEHEGVHRRVTLVYRFHPELDAVLVLWLLVGP